MLPIMTKNDQQTMKVASQSKEKKSVSFSPRVRAKCVRHINDYSDEQIDAIWYSREEMDEQNGELAYTVYMMERGMTIDETEFCTRGLEGQTMEGGQKRLQLYYTMRDAILDEQDYQIQEGIVDDEILATIGNDIAFQCELTARMIGASDAKQVYGSTSRSGPSSTTTSPKLRHHMDIRQKSSKQRNDLRWNNVASDFAPLQKTIPAAVA